MEPILVIVGLVEIAVAIILYQRWVALSGGRSEVGAGKATTTSTGAPRPTLRMAGDPLRITLDIEAPDPNAPTVSRLVHEAAVHAMDEDATVNEVIVADRRGVVLGRLLRPDPLPKRAFEAEGQVDLPSRSRGHTPSVIHGDHAPRPTMSRDVDPAELYVEGRPLAQWFDLPDAVRERLRSEDDAVELLRAILDAAGLAPQVNGDVITCGDRVVVVTGPEVAPGSRDALSHAYLRFAESHATSGLAVAFTYLDPTDVRRREMLAPALRHVSSAGVQRMADAVALGADPLAFAAGPVIVGP